MELSTKEIARVVKLNPKVCLRPVVEIIYDANSEVLKETKTLDLATQPSIYIESSEKVYIYDYADFRQRRIRLRRKKADYTD